MSLFTRTWCFSSVSYMCYVHPTVVAEPLLPSVKPLAMALSPLLAGFGPCTVKGAVWGNPGFELSQTRHLSQIQAPNSKTLCVVLRGFHWWVQPAISPNACPQPSAGAAVKLLCVLIFPSPQDRSHFAMVLAPVQSTCTLPRLRRRF